MNDSRPNRAGEELVFFDFGPWHGPGELHTHPLTTLMFGFLADTRRFVRATHVHLARRWGARVAVTQVHDSAWALALPAGLPLGRFAPLRRINRRLQARLLATKLGRGDGGRLCWLLDWWQIEIAARLHPERLLIDCQDDPEHVFAGNCSRLAEIPGHRAATLAHADLVAAAHPRLLDGLSDGSRRFLPAPNGVSSELLARARQLWPEPEALAGRPRPRLVVVAGEWSFEHRVHHELLAAALAKLEGWTLVLIGVPRSPGRGLATLIGHPRVVALPLQPHLALVPLLKACDVGATPYRRSGGGDAVKTYEYLACGLPVATLSHHPQPFLDPWVTQASSADELADACRNLARTGLAEPERLSALLAELTIERRTQQLLDRLDAIRPPSPI